MKNTIKHRKEKKMSKQKNKYSTCKVVKVNKKGIEVIYGYLSLKDEENGLDSRLDMLGYTIIAL